MDAIAFVLQEHLKLLPDLSGGLEKTCLIHYQDVHSNDLKAVSSFQTVYHILTTHINNAYQ